MGRAPSSSSEETSELTKGPWSKEEDEKLVEYIQKHGHENWRALPKRAGLNRCGKSCRLRWINYLRPNIKRGVFSDEEEQLIFKLHSQLGNKWSRIATYLPGRTDNEIKNYWNTRMKKKLIRNGVDPTNHQPLLNPNLLTNLSLLSLLTYPNWNNGFYPTNNLQLPQNLNMQMLNQKAIDPNNFLSENAFDHTHHHQLSQALMQTISPNPSLNLRNSLGELISYPQQDQFHDIINMVNPSPTLSTPMTSFDFEFQPKLSNLCYNNPLNTRFIPEIETSLPNLVSTDTPYIVNQVESNFCPLDSPSSIFFEDLDSIWNDEANVIQWPENM